MDTPVTTSNSVPTLPNEWDQAVAEIETMRVQVRDRLAMLDHQAGELQKLGASAPESALINVGKATRACDEMKKQLGVLVTKLKTGNADRFNRWIVDNEQALEKKIRACLEAAGHKPVSIDAWVAERSVAGDFSPLTLEIIQISGSFSEWSDIRAGRGCYAAQP